MLVLYSSPISDASARVRLALNLKNIKYELMPMSLSKGDHETKKFEAINPGRTIPTLVIRETSEQDTKNAIVLTQSRVILEYLDEGFPHTMSLLPPISQPLDRAKVRSLVEIIATDVHPLTTPRIGRRITQQFRGKHSDAVQENSLREWDRHWMERGLDLYEKEMGMTAGPYSFGGSVTLADIYLMPELWTATRYGVQLQEMFPAIWKVYQHLMEVEAFREEQHNPSSEFA